jgi:hypothetical protein
METSWSSILIQVVAAVGAVVVSIIGVFGAFYVKRLDNKLKMKTLNDEIRQMVDWSRNSKTFKLMAHEEQINTMVGQMLQFAMDNGITVGEKQLVIMIENIMNYPLKLERAVLKSMQLKEKNK